MIELHQVLVTAAPGDAVTNAAFELQALIDRLPSVAPSAIYARNIDPNIADKVRPLASMPTKPGIDQSGDLLLYHASIGEPAVFEFLMGRPERLALVYHNISPAAAFAPYEPAFAELLESGRRELAALKDRATAAIAVSGFNARELQDLGYRNVRVAPLIVDPQPLHDVAPDPYMSEHLAKHADGPVLLFVGQLLPHKRPDLLIEAFHLVATAMLPEARLMIVGAARLPRFGRLLQQLVNELNLPRCWLTGPVTFPQLAAFYRRADAFVTASEHEGFCAPLIEAMSFGLPITARAHAAIPETLANVGLVLPAGSGAELLAEAMAAVLTDVGVRERVTAGGTERVAGLAPDRSRATFYDELQSLVDA